MTNLDQILYQVTRPARYSGGEWNSVIKDWEATDIKVALAYPDLYEIGMSNLALPILYHLLNSQPDVLAERVYAPWVDMEAAMRQSGIPLFSLESKRPLIDFDIIGFSLGYELTYTNVLNMLDLSRIPVLAAERDQSYPLIIAGGVSALNPEPMSDFIDLFVIGDGEEALLEIVDLFRSQKKGARWKQSFLHRAATLPGIYVPRFYLADYLAAGQLAGIAPLVPEAKATIQRRIVAKLPPPVTKPVVPYVEAVHDRAAVEIQRGCVRGCRFCQAGIIYRPLRERSPEEVVEAVDQLLQNCGYNEVSLLSFSTTDYSAIEPLVNTLSQRLGKDNINLSLPSLRMDSFSVKLMDILHPRRKTNLTFAPEAGSEQLRRVINKSISDDDILEVISAALERGWSGFKLYFMLGLPTESTEDVEAIAGLVRQILKLGKGKQPRVKVSLSNFVPKPHTPFQWVPQATEEQLRPRYESLKAGLRRTGIQLSWQDPRMSWLEAVFSRGDRRLGQIILRAWQTGCRFDAWSEHFDYQKWVAAFSECALDPSFYAYRHRPLDEILPWAHIDVGVCPDFLKQEYQRAEDRVLTPNCSAELCNVCGLERWYPECSRRRAKLTTDVS